MLTTLWWLWLVVLTMAGVLLGVFCWALSDENTRLQRLVDADPDCHQCEVVRQCTRQGEQLNIAWGQLDHLHAERRGAKVALVSDRLPEQRPS